MQHLRLNIFEKFFRGFMDPSHISPPLWCSLFSIHIIIPPFPKNVTRFSVPFPFFANKILPEQKYHLPNVVFAGIMEPQ